jgi:hypothetical protein
MKKMFLATCLLAASVFAAPSAEDVKAVTEKPAVEAGKDCNNKEEG